MLAISWLIQYNINVNLLFSIQDQESYAQQPTPQSKTCSPISQLLRNLSQCQMCFHYLHKQQKRPTSYQILKYKLAPFKALRNTTKTQCIKKYLISQGPTKEKSYSVSMKSNQHKLVNDIHIKPSQYGSRICTKSMLIILQP